MEIFNGKLNLLYPISLKKSKERIKKGILLYKKIEEKFSY